MPEVGRLSLLQWPLEIAAILLLITGLLYPLTQWSTLPDRIPSHFNIKGIPDRWAGRWIFGWFAILQIAIYGTLSYQSWTLGSLLGTAPPPTFTTLSLIWMKVVIAGLFAFLNWTIVRVARAEAEKANIFALVAVSGLLVVPALFLTIRGLGPA